VLRGAERLRGRGVASAVGVIMVCVLRNGAKGDWVGISAELCSLDRGVRNGVSLILNSTVRLIEMHEFEPPMLWLRIVVVLRCNVCIFLPSLVFYPQFSKHYWQHPMPVLSLSAMSILVFRFDSKCVVLDRHFLRVSRELFAGLETKNICFEWHTSVARCPFDLL
jgi:hypothetical protein